MRNGSGENEPIATRWLLVTVEPPPRGEEVLLVAALRSAGARAVEREGERYRALFPAPAKLDALLGEIGVAIRASTSLRDPRLAWRWLSPEEWARVWVTDFEPIRAGERLVVAPAGTEPPLCPGDLLIRLVSGTAFGTAEHPTTRGCLRYLESFLSPGEQVADIGAGSGILSIAAALLGAREVHAFEQDRYACADARENLRLNGVADRVELREATVTPETLLHENRYQGMVANLQASILFGLLPAMSLALAPHGWIIVSGILRQERQDVIVAATEGKLRLAAEEVEDGWWTACFR